jgi:hypothetical protein
MLKMDTQFQALALHFLCDPKNNAKFFTANLVEAF